jgi:tRNA (guanosine-2'-O-)-methyltransferase
MRRGHRVVLALATLVLGCSRPPATSQVVAAKGVSATGAVVTRTPDRACVAGGPERCFDATDDNCNGVIDEGCGVETGPVQFVIAWDAPAADVDLRVTDPNGELAEAGRPLASGLVKQRDCPGRNNDCRGQNLENVFLDALEAPPGTYKVRIVLEELGGESPPIRVRFGARVGPRSYQYEVRLDGADARLDAQFTL